MKKIVITLAFIAVAMFTVFSPVTHAAPKPQQPFIECQNTTWVLEKSASFTDSFTGTWEHDKLFALRDSTSNAYCDEVKAENVFDNLSTGICDNFYSNLWDGGVLQLLASAHVNNCGGNGFVQTNPYSISAGDIVFAEADVNNGMLDDVKTANWTIS